MRQPEISYFLPETRPHHSQRATLAELDGLSIKNVRRMPHPVELRDWADSNFYTIDLENDCFRLTDRGCEAVKSARENYCAESGR